MPVVTSVPDWERKWNDKRRSPVMDFFKFESNRLLSFQNWSGDYPVLPFVLAFFGFYALPPRDTQCFTCHKRVSDWKNGDDPITRHVEMSPKCQFLMKPQEGNVPLSIQERYDILKRLNDSSGGDSEIFKLEKNRLLTFGDSRLFHPQNFPVWYGLAADGFFAINQNTVECFACHGQISLNLQFKAVVVHDMMYEHCPLQSAAPCGNRPIVFTELESLKQSFHQPGGLEATETLGMEDSHNLAVITEKNLSDNQKEEHYL